MFGDLHLESIRKKREEKCNRSGIEAAFPLWGKSPESVLSEFIESGFKAIVTCIDTSVLPEEFIGRVIDNDFLSELPPNADICGENGEYHSFVFDGPVFKHPVKFTAKRTYDKTYLNRQTNTFHRYRYLELE